MDLKLPKLYDESINKDSFDKTIRKKIKDIFENSVYGIMPNRPKKVQYKTLNYNTNFLDGLGESEQIDIIWGKPNNSTRILVCKPKKKPIKGLFIALNFTGNHTVTSDDNIIININRKYNRGYSKSRWPINKILQEGYCLVTCCYEDIISDDNSKYEKEVKDIIKITRSEFDTDKTGAIALWAWGLGLLMDYVKSNKGLKNLKTIVMGHSRLGKTALYYSMMDTRADMVISNNSGCAGASLFRHKMGENILNINTNFPHWFCEKFKEYNKKEEVLPIDQNMLLASIAPRPLFIASAFNDNWADPIGEYLSAKEASKIYNLYGFDDKYKQDLPEIDIMVGNRIRYFMRDGEHDVKLEDWIRYIEFANSFI